MCRDGRARRHLTPHPVSPTYGPRRAWEHSGKVPWAIYGVTSDKTGPRVGGRIYSDGSTQQTADQGQTRYCCSTLLEESVKNVRRY